MHSSLVVLLVLSMAVAVESQAAAKFGMSGMSMNNKECPANVLRLLSLMCKDDRISGEYCDAHVSSLTRLVEKYSTFDADTILAGECCSEKRCRLSVLRSLCCIDGLRITDDA